MIKVNHHIQINKPVEEVFRYAANPVNDPEWCPPVLEVSRRKVLA